MIRLPSYQVERLDIALLTASAARELVKITEYMDHMNNAGRRVERVVVTSKTMLDIIDAINGRLIGGGALSRAGKDTAIFFKNIPVITLDGI